jgi:hypothetical protein
MGDGCLELNSILSDICLEVDDKGFTSNDVIVDEVIRRTREKIDKIDDSNVTDIAFAVWDNLVNGFNIDIDTDYIEETLL